MKEYLQAAVAFAVLLMIIPCVVFLSPNKPQAAALPESSAVQGEKPADAQTVKIYFTDEKKLREYTMQEYMTGAVLAQMPADLEPAALQAQAILARTYALYRTQSESAHPTPALCGAVMSDDTKLYHGFFTEQQAKALYKDGYGKAREKIEQAVKAVQGKYLAYDGKPIIVAFHAVSDGHTRSAKDVWGQDIPYLASVESKLDEPLKQAVSKTEITSAQLKEKLGKVYDDITFAGSADSWLKITQTGEYGLVKQISVCGRQIPADELCEALDLSSQSFTFELSGDKFIFTCKGLGHMVGMSQLGANEMAKQGKTCEQILTHYFKGCKICDNSPQSS
jgi:stage II sporulation protein D